MVEEEVCLHPYFGGIWRHILLLDEPQMPMVIIEAHAAYPFPFVYTPQRDINHIISYYTYFGFERLDNPLRLLLQFFGHDVNEWATRSNFCWDTSIENFKDTGDFIDNKDLPNS